MRSKEKQIKPCVKHECHSQSWTSVFLLAFSFCVLQSGETEITKTTKQRTWVQLWSEHLREILV